MSDERQTLTRADLPEELTPEVIRRLPMSTLRRLAKPGNGVLRPEEQADFDAVLHQVMSETAGRVARQVSRPDWQEVLRDAGARGARRAGAGPPSRVDEHLNRMAKRIDRQVDAAEALAPDVDWSFAQPALRPSGEPPAGPPPEPPAPIETSDADSETVHDLEERLTEQVELVQVMSEIADVSKRTYALEKQRDLQTTRGIFFGFVVSVAVLVAGWAPLVAADDWHERIWVLGLTLATCVAAGLVYGLIRRWQNRHEAETDEQEQAA